MPYELDTSVVLEAFGHGAAIGMLSKPLNQLEPNFFSTNHIYYASYFHCLTGITLYTISNFRRCEANKYQQKGSAIGFVTVGLGILTGRLFINAVCNTVEKILESDSTSIFK